MPAGPPAEPPGAVGAGLHPSSNACGLAPSLKLPTLAPGTYVKCGTAAAVPCSLTNSSLPLCDTRHERTRGREAIAQQRRYFCF